MKQRLLVAAVGVPALLVVLVICPPWATTALVAVMAGVSAYELLNTAGKAIPFNVLVMTIVIAAIQVIFLSSGSDAFAIGSVSSVTVVRFYFLVLLFFCAVVRYGKAESLSFRDLAVAIVGGIVFPAMFSAIALLRQTGPSLVLMPFVIAFLGDSASMLAGSKWGRKKLAPAVSPNKTWAGFYAGPVGSALGMVLLGLIERWVWSFTVPLWKLALIGAVGNLFGQLGDLATSLIKREAGIKDYSHLFLTHGGMLDRFDSILFIAPVVYFFLQGGIL